LVNTTKSKTLTVDSNFNIIWWSSVYIENNLDAEEEYRLGGVRIKNAVYSDGTFGLVNAMTLNPVELKVNGITITSIDDEEDEKYIVTLANDDELSVTAHMIGND